MILCHVSDVAELIVVLSCQGTILIRQHPSSHRLNEIYVDLHKLLDKEDAQVRYHIILLCILVQKIFSFNS